MSKHEYKFGDRVTHDYDGSHGVVTGLDDDGQNVIVTTNINAALHLIAGWYRRMG